MSLAAHFFSGFIFLIQPLYNSKESKFKVNVMKLNKIDKRWSSRSDRYSISYRFTEWDNKKSGNKGSEWIGTASWGYNQGYTGNIREWGE